VHVQVQGLKIGLTFRICQHTIQHALCDDAIFGFLSTEIWKQQQQPQQPEQPQPRTNNKQLKQQRASINRKEQSYGE